MSTFTALGVRKPYIKALKELGIEQPTAVQEQVIPLLMGEATDLVAQAQTGTGKTAAFGLPLLHRIQPDNQKVQALVLAPTRELGQQIAKQLFRYTKFLPEKVFTECVYGGAPIDRQISNLKRPTQIVVATPGRLIDLLNRKAVNISNVHTVVLDEADEMLSMGFKKALETILEHVGNDRNTWLFSATMPRDIQQLIADHLHADAHHVQIDKKNVVNKNILHRYVVVEDGDKLNELVRFLKSQKGERGVVFTKTRKGAVTLTKQLQSKNFATDVIEGEMLQKERDKAMRAFKKENLQFLVCTDVAARGIDVPGLAFVAHYDVADQTDYYTHRSGRTARAGSKGVSLTFLNKSEIKKLRYLERTLGIVFERL